MVVQEPSALDRLRTMERVGIGGAAMMQDLGDKLVKDGVSLISRFGSSESGFLLSSERDFPSDQEWSILRGMEQILYS